MGRQWLVAMEEIDKHFPFVQAVSQGQFYLKKGEIHALVGENGAGKSTLMKILYGLYAIDNGKITIGGEEINSAHYNTHEAIRLGIGMVHQEFMLVNELSVLENVVLGMEPVKRLGRLDYVRAEELVKQYSENYHLDVQTHKIVNNISVGEMQRVEIIKALYRGAEILILDEPTSVLTPQEVQRLFVVLRSMQQDGKTIIFISHKLGEVMEISDRVTVMRRSKFVATVNTADTSPRELSRLMVGRDIEFDSVPVKSNPGEEVLRVDHLFVMGNRELSTIKNISFSIRQGEVLGVAGIEGNGQTELVEALAGLRPSQGGSIHLNGRDITNLSPKQIRDIGLAHIPEDRNLRGLNKTLSVYDNLYVTQTGNREFSSPLRRKVKKIVEFGNAMIEKYDIRPANGKSLAGQFSGGNAQKIVIAREVGMKKPLLIAAQPTRGVDVGAIEAIRGIINKAKLEGIAILLVSADLSEILSLSDQIIVLYEGSISGKLKGGPEVDIEELGLLMMGDKKQA